MFTANLEDTAILKDAIQTIATLINEAVFKITPNGISLTATDPTMVAMVRFELSKTAFSAYNFEKEENIGLNLENLNSILRRSSASDILEVSVDESQFSITLRGDTVRKFSLPILSLDTAQVPDIQGLNFTTTLDVKSSALSTAIGDASVIGDSVTLQTTENGLVIESKGDSSKARFSIGKESEMILNLEGPAAKASFSISYLNKLIKAEKLAETIKMKMGNDFPMKLEFRVPEKCNLDFVLAPRIEED